MELEVIKNSNCIKARDAKPGKIYKYNLIGTDYFCLKLDENDGKWCLFVTLDEGAIFRLDPEETVTKIKSARVLIEE